MAQEPDNTVVYFARTNFRNSNRLFGIKRTDRRQHTYVIGKTGTGKSSLLNNMIVQDIANGEGVCVVDPHGELVEGVLDKIPEERMGDVVYFNPADPDYHIGFNILELPDPKYKHLVASGLMAIFTKIWSGVWSPRMEYILNNCILALLDTPGSTLLGIPRLLTDKDYRQKVIANVQDPVVKAFWVHEFESWQDRFRNEAIAPIQNKVGQFLSTSLVRNIVGQSKSTIDVFKIMNEGKIFLVNVSKGRIGEDNSALLGAMLITKIQLAAMERVRIPEDERIDFYLYVDEFQNFATDSFAGILSEARKYRLNLTLAHQYIGQLVTDTSTRVRDAIFGNVGTMIVFRVGAADAEFLEKEFTPEFTIEDIVNLPNYHIYLKLMVSGVTARPFSAGTLPTFKVQTSPIVKEDIIKMSQTHYARPRELIESEINQWSGMMGTPAPAGGAAISGPASSSASARAAVTAAAGMPAGDPAKGPDYQAKPVATAAGVRYQAICSSCGNLTTLPFEPTPGRPVYCRDCMKKIESGELKPIKTSWSAPKAAAPAAKPVEKLDTSLSDLGIEFAKPQPVSPMAAAPAASAPAPTMQPVAEQPPIAKPQVSAPTPVSAPAPSRAQTPVRMNPVPVTQQSVPPSPIAKPAEAIAPRNAPPSIQRTQAQPQFPSQPQPQTISLSALAKAKDPSAAATGKAKFPPKAEISISALRAAIKASLDEDVAMGGDESSIDARPAAGAASPAVPEHGQDEDDDYEKDRSYRNH